MKKTFMLITLLAIAVLAGSWMTGSVNAETIPTISIVSVVPGKVVTVQTYNFPENVEFTAWIGEFGSMGVGGVEAGKVNSDQGGTFTATFSIPEKFQSEERLAIRLESSTTGYYAYNWFDNIISPGAASTPTATTQGTPAPESSSVPDDYSGYPALTIASVKAGDTVSVAGMNFIPGKDFVVTMDLFGHMGIGGLEVTTQKTGDTGDFEAEYKIPADLKDAYLIAIRLENTESGYYAYNWFYNTSTVSDTPVESSTPTTASSKTDVAIYSGYPELTITGVVKDKKVTLMVSNLANDIAYDVNLGAFGSTGENGTKIGTVKATKDGEATADFDLPETFIGMDKIAIRVQDPTTSIYGYAWFYNATYP